MDEQDEDLDVMKDKLIPAVIKRRGGLLVPMVMMVLRAAEVRAIRIAMLDRAVQDDPSTENLSL
jgi:hypothetical protein